MNIKILKMKSESEKENFLDMESEPASTSEGATDFTYSTYKDQIRFESDYSVVFMISFSVVVS